MGVGTAHAKLLLFGEHAAVYGHPAVGCALPWSLTIAHEPGPWDTTAFGDHGATVSNLLTRLGELATEAGWPRPSPGRLTLDTDIPLASGFGSSGALCAALTNLFWPDRTLEERDAMAWRAEGLFHGTPSGIDTALALREGWWHLDTSSRPPRATRLPEPNLTLVVGALVRESDTKTLVAGLAKRRTEPSVSAALDRLGALSAQASQALSEGRLDLLPALVVEARAGLCSLGLESPDLTAVLDEGERSEGCRGGKLSGAGGGGAFYLVFEDAHSARACLPRLEAAVPPGLWTARPQVIDRGTNLE